MSVDLCFQYAVGLSRSECNCFDNGRTNNPDRSDSGIYLDELVNLRMIEAASDCEKGNLWELMEQSREQGITEFKSDLLSCIATKAKVRRNPYGGPIAEYKTSPQQHVLSKTYHGIQLYMAKIAGGISRITRIGTGFNQTTTLDITIYSNMSDVPVATYNGVPTQANQIYWYTLPTPLELDMMGEYNRNVEYFIVYQPVAGLEALDVKVNCGCQSGFQPYYDISRPSFLSDTPKGRFGFANYLMVAGTRGNDLSIRDRWGTVNETQGLLLDMNFGCDTEKTLCDGTIDYKTNPFARAMAYAIRFKAAANLIYLIQRSSNVNRYTLLDGDRMERDRQEFLKEYNDRVQLYLCEQLTHPDHLNMNTDCYTCRDTSGFIKMKLFN